MNIMNVEITKYQDPTLYEYVDVDNPWMKIAREAAIRHSLTPVFPIGVAAVKKGKVIAVSANGNGYHEKNLDTPEHKKGCKRRYISTQRELRGASKLASGEGFDLCPGCDVDYHAEARLIQEVETLEELEGATIYMYGHWWCCGSCWEKMKKAKVAKVCVVGAFQNKENLVRWRDEFARER